METFCDWLSCSSVLHGLRLIETYFSFDARQYNHLFDDELHKLSASSTQHSEALKRLAVFNWVAYIAKSVRNAGYRDQREVQERTHDIVVKMLTGGLFRDYDDRQHGPLDIRFKRSVANAIKNMVEKERNRRHYIPAVPIGQEFTPGGVTDLPDRARHDDDDAGVIDGFRGLVRKRLGELAVGVLDGFLQGTERKALVGNPELGRPGKAVIKRLVQKIKALAREYAAASGNSELLRSIGRATAREAATIRQRRTTAAARQNG
jgi:hypothetical protein